MFHSTDVKDILGNANWNRGWVSCLTHRFKAKTFDLSPKERANQGEGAREVALWAAHTQGVSLLYISDGRAKTQAGISRRAMFARGWLFELECGALVFDAVHGPDGIRFDFTEWLQDEGGACYGLIEAKQARQQLRGTSWQERRVKGSGPLCPALERRKERVIWPGWDARRAGAPMKGPRFWQATRTELVLDVGHPFVD